MTRAGQATAEVTFALPPGTTRVRFVGGGTTVTTPAANGVAVAVIEAVTNEAGPLSITASAQDYTPASVSVDFAPVYSHGVLRESATWSGHVYMDGDFVVDFGAQLTIQPGTIVHFKPNASAWDTTYGTSGRADIIVYHSVQAIGSSSARIRFEALGGGEGAGLWGALVFLDSSIDALNVVDNCLVRNATSAVILHDASPRLVRSRFERSSEYGIWANGEQSDVAVEDDTVVKWLRRSCLIRRSTGRSAVPLRVVESLELNPPSGPDTPGDEQRVQRWGQISVSGPADQRGVCGGGGREPGEAGGVRQPGEHGAEGMDVLVRRYTELVGVELNVQPSYQGQQPTLTAVVDSNEVVAGSGDGLVFKDASYYGQYGTLTAQVRANTVTGKSGAGILVSRGNYGYGANVTVAVTAEDNQVTGCGYGVKVEGKNLVLQRNVITRADSGCTARTPRRRSAARWRTRTTSMETTGGTCTARGRSCRHLTTTGERSTRTRWRRGPGAGR
jgi:hypothetical protein